MADVIWVYAELSDDKITPTTLEMLTMEPRRRLIMPRRRSNTARGLYSIGSGCVALRHEIAARAD